MNRKSDEVEGTNPKDVEKIKDIQQGNLKSNSYELTSRWNSRAHVGIQGRAYSSTVPTGIEKIRRRT